MNENYTQLVEFISRSTGISIEEIERKIEAKQAKLAGLISKEGAAQVVAAELNINFDKQVIKISQIVPGMRKINLIGKVINLFPIKEYNKNGRSGRIGSFVIADETSNIRTVLWDENHIDLIEKGEIVNECIVEITNANLRNGELHLTSFSEIKPSDKIFESVVVSQRFSRKTLDKFISNERVSARAFIVQIFEPRFFQVCPQCRKKVNEIGECLEHGRVIPEKRMLLNFVIDDGSDSIRSVIFSDQIEKLIIKEELENPDKFAVKKKDLIGKELIFSGQVRKNEMYNNNEFIISDVEEIDLDKLIDELER